MFGVRRASRDVVVCRGFHLPGRCPRAFLEKSQGSLIFHCSCSLVGRALFFFYFLSMERRPSDAIEGCILTISQRGEKEGKNKYIFMQNIFFKNLPLIGGIGRTPCWSISW
jgi:hypothetical protein